MSVPSTTERPEVPRENVLLNLVCNVVLPGFMLSQLSKDTRLGPIWGLVAALAVPLLYGAWDFFRRRIWNVFSVLGLFSVVLTGVLGLLKTDPIWFAMKEVAIPLVLGLAIPLTLKTKQPLVRTLLYNDQLMDTARIHGALESRGTTVDFEALLKRTSWILAASFIASGVVNFVLARWLLTAPLGTATFNDQLGKMHWISWPVVFLPMLAVLMFAMLRLMRGVEKLTGLTNDEILHQPKKT